MRRQYNSPRRESSRRIVQGAIILDGNSPGAIVQGAFVQGAIVLGGDCPGGNCPGTIVLGGNCSEDNYPGGIVLEPYKCDKCDKSKQCFNCHMHNTISSKCDEVKVH